MFFKKSSFPVIQIGFGQRVTYIIVATLIWVPLNAWGVQSAHAQETGLTAAASSDGTSAPTKPTPPDNSQWVEASVSDLRQSSQHWIQIDLSDQRLTAWEGNTPVFSIIVSTGRAEDMTPTGVYSIEDKYRTARMQGEHQGERYDIPDVPYTMYFSGSYAIHGAYWHSNFGTPVSSGCINVPVEGAAWLFDWAGVGTAVVVQN